MLQIGIAGAPGAGKTTVFNVLARAHAAVGLYSAQPNVAVVKVPDHRLEQLGALFKPKKLTPAEIRYLDVGAAAAGPEGERDALSELRQTDLLLLVVRGFESPLGQPEPRRESQQFESELLLADLAVVERRLQRLEKEVRLGRGPEPERQAGQRDLTLLQAVKTQLEADRPVRAMPLTPQDELVLRGYGLLSAKPILLVLNLSEPEADAETRSRGDASASGLQGDISTQLLEAGAPRKQVTSLCGRLEMELLDLDPAEAAEFAREFGVTQDSLPRIIHLSYALADLISFFTVSPDEVRAWTIKQGSTALEAAAAVHSDIARGFIRAEVIAWDDLLQVGGLAETRRRGLLRLEGKSYPVQDGEVVHILFNV